MGESDLNSRGPNALSVRSSSGDDFNQRCMEKSSWRYAARWFRSVISPPDLLGLCPAAVQELW
jgi:hypothetical protein